MVIERVVAILDGQHPGAEQEPQHRRHRLADARDEIEYQQHQRARQVVGQLAPFARHNARQIFHNAKNAGIRQRFAGQAAFQLFGQQATERGGNQVGNGAEQIAEHQQDGDHRQRPQNVA
ncbi:hypothetical protein D3C71_1901920 [compost metagenome]